MKAPTQDSKSGKSSHHNALADLSLYQLSKMIRKGEISSKELVEVYLDRIRIFDGRKGLNAYVTVAADDAMRQAERLDKLARSKTFKGPLHGLPIAIKDNIDTKDIRTTGGTKILAGWRPSRDARVVEKLKEAGAVILGKTNLHEFAFGITNNNPHYGPTRNPYDYSRIPGGSSGGSAAATAAALCAGSIGSDTGGSIRIPAALCGIVGLKPTLGRVGRGGLMMMSFSKDVVGPITRTVIDAAMMLEAISGKDPRDPESAHNPVPEYSALLSEGIKEKRFCVPKRHFFDLVHEDTQKVFDDALGVIRNMGGIVNDVEVRHIDLAPHSFNVSLSECVFLLEEYLKAFDPEATIEKYLDQLGADVKGFLGSQKGMADSKPVPGYDYVKTVRKHRNKMIAGFEEALFNRDALLIPTTPLPATRIEDDVETELLGKKVNTFRAFTRNCNPISMVGYPAITVPAGYSASGLPIGLQIVTRPWEEDKLLSMAHAFEQATKVRRRPELAAS